MDIWTTCIFDLGLSQFQFERLTLKQFNALVRRLNKHTEDKKYNHASLLAAINNQAASKKSELMKPEDFLGKESKPSQEDLDIKMYNAFATIKKLNNA